MKWLCGVLVTAVYGVLAYYAARGGAWGWFAFDVAAPVVLIYWATKPRVYPPAGGTIPSPPPTSDTVRVILSKGGSEPVETPDDGPIDEHPADRHRRLSPNCPICLSVEDDD